MAEKNMPGDAAAGAPVLQGLRIVEFPAFVAAPGSEAVELALALTGAGRTQAVSYATEAGLFEQAGVPTVICGPGNIAQMHTADEYVAVAQLEACLAFLDGLAAKLSA